jgi:hypothetical protein
VAVELAEGLCVVVDRPHGQFVVVPTSCELLLVVGPFETTNFLFMILQGRIIIILLSQITVQYSFVLRSRTNSIRRTSNCAHTPFVALHRADELTLVDVPHLDHPAVGADGEVLAALRPTDRGHTVAHTQVVQLGHFAASGGPDVDATGQAHY